MITDKNKLFKGILLFLILFSLASLIFIASYPNSAGAVCTPPPDPKCDQKCTDSEGFADWDCIVSCTDSYDSSYESYSSCVASESQKTEVKTSSEPTKECPSSCPGVDISRGDGEGTEEYAARLKSLYDAQNACLEARRKCLTAEKKAAEEEKIKQEEEMQRQEEEKRIAEKKAAKEKYQAENFWDLEREGLELRDAPRDIPEEEEVDLDSHIYDLREQLRDFQDKKTYTSSDIAKIRQLIKSGRFDQLRRETTDADHRINLLKLKREYGALLSKTEKLEKKGLKSKKDLLKEYTNSLSDSKKKIREHFAALEEISARGSEEGFSEFDPNSIKKILNSPELNDLMKTSNAKERAEILRLKREAKALINIAEENIELSLTNLNFPPLTKEEERRLDSIATKYSEAPPTQPSSGATEEQTSNFLGQIDEDYRDFQIFVNKLNSQEAEIKSLESGSEEGLLFLEIDKVAVEGIKDNLKDEKEKLERLGNTLSLNYGKVLLYDPNNVKANMAMGDIAKSQGRFDDAREFYQRAMEATPYNAQAIAIRHEIVKNLQEELNLKNEPDPKISGFLKKLKNDAEFLFLPEKIGDALTYLPIKPMESLIKARQS